MLRDTKNGRGVIFFNFLKKKVQTEQYQAAMRESPSSFLVDGLLERKEELERSSESNGRNQGNKNGLDDRLASLVMHACVFQVD
jgi:hypothetical protein